MVQDENSLKSYILFRMNLYDFGKLLQSYGLVNAINLDGGGSATFVENGTVVNYPSDQW
jgi:N-acetylglucosamine-1-phosphodiester alpha-N-acetylglucosaminidase